LIGRLNMIHDINSGYWLGMLIGFISGTFLYWAIFINGKNNG
jgi:hypothetical protein